MSVMPPYAASTETESNACTGGVPHRFELTTRGGMVISESCVWCGLTYKYN